MGTGSEFYSIGNHTKWKREFLWKPAKIQGSWYWLQYVMREYIGFEFNAGLGTSTIWASTDNYTLNEKELFLELL